MATFFGELVIPPSRAGVDEDEEAAAEREETQEDREIRLALEKKREVQISWNTTPDASANEQLPCSTLILGVGHNAVGGLGDIELQDLLSAANKTCSPLNHLLPVKQAFLAAFLLNSGGWEEVGSIQLWNEWCRTSNMTKVLPTDSFCLFYRSISDPTVLLCQCNCFVAEDQQFQWTEKVFGCLHKTTLQVLVLSSCSVTDYKTAESTLMLPSPFLKALKTKEFKDQVLCPLLEQPNIVWDLPAAVLSYCQVWQIPAVLYQCYTDILKLDLETIEAFKPLLSSSPLQSLVKDISTSTELLTKLATANEIHNIYT